MPHQPRPDLAPSTRALLDAVLSISADLDLATVLSRIVTSATELTHARYGALGVIGPDGELVEYVTNGPDEPARADDTGPLRGAGLQALGPLAQDTGPLRLLNSVSDPRPAGLRSDDPPTGTYLGVPVRIRGTVFGNLYLAGKAWDEPFSDEDEVLVCALADVAGFVIENARAYGQSEQRRRWLEASAQLSDATHDLLDAGHAAEEVARTARAASHALGAAVLGVAEGEPVLSAAPDAREQVAAAVDELLAGDATGANGLGADAFTERRAAGLRARVLPLRTRLVDRGVLVVLDHAPHGAPDVEERELLLTFAEQSGLTLDRARALSEREELAVISDRERIARDLHDVVIQRLFATGLRLQGISMTADSPDLAARLSDAVDELDQTIKDIRGTIFELQRQRSDSLRTALRDLAREYAPVLGLTPEVTTRGPVDSVVPAEVAQHLITVAREALSNVARHARAHTAELFVLADADEVRLEVRDDGVGLGATGAGVESGLRNARRRADALGGRVELVPRQPRGTTLVWTAPL